MASDYGESIGNDTVRFQRLLPGPIDLVWRFLTESELRAKWLAAGETELRAGGRVELHFHNAGLSRLPDDPAPEKYQDLPAKVSYAGEVTECDPPNTLRYTWVGDDETSEVCYQLEARGEQTLLTLTHTRLATRDIMLGVLGGWHTHLDILNDVMLDEEPQPFWRRHTALEAEYTERIEDAT